MHQHMQVRQENAESDGDRETKLHKEVLHVLLVLTTLKPVQTYMDYSTLINVNRDKKKYVKSSVNLIPIC